MPVSGDFATTATLVDGESVTIRRLNPDDYDAVVALAIGLSEEERYLRFFTGHPTYIGDWALSLTAPAEGVVALGVFESGELIGVANYSELSQPGYAEIAVVVAHEQHERGVGTALLRALGRHCTERRPASFCRRRTVRKLRHAPGDQRCGMAHHSAP